MLEHSPSLTYIVCVQLRLETFETMGTNFLGGAVGVVWVWTWASSLQQTGVCCADEGCLTWKSSYILCALF